ncbi:MAG: stage III sporulation protein AG [Thermicanus sp.]|nr:stage III sporulation protein AG [Thermicanus sp.]
MASKWSMDRWQWTIILIGLAAGLFLMGSFFKVQEEKNPPPPEASDAQAVQGESVKEWTMKDYEEFYENSLREILEQIVGVGQVTVMVNLDSTEEKVYQTNLQTGKQVTEEKDTQGGTRTVEDTTQNSQVVTVTGGGGEQPIVVKTVKPKIRGVVVVANGVENMQVKAWIFDVIERSLDVPPHRISIAPRKKGN